LSKSPIKNEANHSPRSAAGPQGRAALPQHAVDIDHAPGHWVLARLGKRVLRPGGIELTRRMLAALDIGPDDHVVEFAPGLGATARVTLARGPASYVAVERDETATEQVRRYVDGPDRRVLVGSAETTGLPDGCATVVYGEAMLTMQLPATKERIVNEAVRLLRTGGRYGIHEMAIVPDGIAADLRQEIHQEVSHAIRHTVRMLTPVEWADLLHRAGVDVINQRPRRCICWNQGDCCATRGWWARYAY
jgi:SAM-dependent methyltransferase